eukprot:6491160-Heterocapsa_arctica.AAC.1
MFEQREAMWQYQPVPRAPDFRQPGQQAGAAEGTRGGGQGGGKVGQQAGKLSSKDLCRAWNMGKCKEPCPGGRLH